VTADAVAGDAGVIEHGAAPAAGVVAVVAAVVTGDMIGRLADGGGAVVTGGAGADDVGVIDTGDRNPAAGAVTVLTERVGLDVGGVLAGGGGAVVASGAIAVDVGVVEDRTVPAGGVMAVLAYVTIANMCWMLAGGRGAIVAGKAGADDVGVSDTRDRDPAAGAMAVLTERVGLDVGGVLAGGAGAVVAADAIAVDVGVVEDCAAPAGRSMAVVAIAAAGYVVSRFADSGLSVMTETAGAGNITVLEPGDLLPVGSDMTIFAGVTGRYMIGGFAFTA